MTDRTAGSVNLVEDGPSEAADTTKTSDTGGPATGRKPADAKASQVAIETMPMSTLDEDDIDGELDGGTGGVADGTAKSGGATDTRRTGTPKSNSASNTSNGSAPTNGTAAAAPGKSAAEAAAASAADSGSADAAEETGAPASGPGKSDEPKGRSLGDITRGTRLADRYRLEDKLSSHGKSATWRAVDEKLRRAVGVHIVVAGSEYARSVMAAARAAALVGDPRFVQVLDAAEEDGLVYVVKEWLPDADNLATLLATNPLPPHEAYEMTRSVADAMAVAHRAGLSHLRLDPDNVLRMHTGQYKIVGLSVEAALYGHDTTDAARDDTRAIGSLLYACLARRWPDSEAYGLAQAPRAGGKLCSPGQVKANVHKPLETIAMRALGHEVKHQAPFEAPEDVVAALAAIPPILPPEPEPPVSAAGADFDDEYTPTAVLSPHGGFTSGPPPAVRRPVPAGPPPALGGGFGGAVKVIVSLVVLVAVVLATWQIAVHFNAQKDEDPKPSPSGSPSAPQAPAAPQKPTALNIVSAKELNVDKNGSPASAQNTDDINKSFDGDPTTFWRTSSFYDGPQMKLRDGLGIVYDLGSEQELRTAHVKLMAGGNYTEIELRAAPAGSGGSPSSLSAFTTLKKQKTSDADLDFALDQPVKARYVLIWITAMPHRTSNKDIGVYEPGYQDSIAEVSFTS